MRRELDHRRWASAPVAAYAVVFSHVDRRTSGPDVEAVRAAGLPTLILHGTKDNILADRRLRAALSYAAVPDAEVRRGRGRAPRPAVDAPADEVNAALLAFVDK